MYVRTHQKSINNFAKFQFQICIIIGVLLMVLAPIGALRNIILQAKTFNFFS